jgi:hypothetical protein
VCVECRGEYVESIHFFNPVACFLYKGKDLSAPLIHGIVLEEGKEEYDSTINW